MYNRYIEVKKKLIPSLKCPYYALSVDILHTYLKKKKKIEHFPANSAKIS